MRWIVSRTRASQSPSGYASSTCSIPASWESSSANGTTSTQRASATIGRSRYQRLRVQGRNGFVVVIVQLAPEEPRSPEPFCGRQAWKDDYPWLHRAVKEIGPGARGASDSWRVRIEDELKTTLDFKVRLDGTAAVWCGMSGYDFHHDPTPKELFEGLAEAYRRERKRVAGGNPWKMSAARLAPPEWTKPLPPVRASPPCAEDSLIRTLGAVFLPRLVQLILIFLAVTALTLVLSSVANAVR